MYQGLSLLLIPQRHRRTNVQTFAKGTQKLLPPTPPLLLGRFASISAWPKKSDPLVEEMVMHTKWEYAVHGKGEIYHMSKEEWKTWEADDYVRPAATTRPAGWDLLLHWGSQLDTWCNSGNITGVRLSAIGACGFMGFSETQWQLLSAHRGFSVPF